jgi:adenylate cyclase
MELHRVLKRQLKKILGGENPAPPNAEQWAKLLERVNNTYNQSDEDRYTLERSLGLSSQEMRELQKKLEKQNVILDKVLKRYLSEEIADDILKNPDEKLQLGGETLLVSVLFADIRGFTTFSKSRDAKIVMKKLNQIFDRVVRIVFENDGTFDKFIGDALMAFYGAPISYENDALRAVRTAVKMQEAIKKLHEEDSTLKELKLGIGIYTGYAVVGNLGSEQMMNYTVIGDTPNMASRFQDHAKASQILIDSVTYEAVGDPVKVRGLEPLKIKGKKAPIAAYEVLGLVEEGEEIEEKEEPMDKDIAL